MSCLTISVTNFGMVGVSFRNGNNQNTVKDIYIMFSKFSFAPNLVVIKLCNIILLTLYLLLCFYNKYIRIF